MIITGNTVKNALIDELMAWGFIVYRDTPNVLTFPHFFITQLPVTIEKAGNNCFFLRYLFNIRYRHAEITNNANILSTLDRVGMEMLSHLATIKLSEDIEIDGETKTIERIYPLTDMRYEKDLGMLQFFCSVMIPVSRDIANDAVLMEELIFKLNTKGE